MAIYRILSLDGGGIRGILSATILQELEKQAPGWIKKVDLIAGTSTGGILALGLARGLTPDALRKLYYDYCDKIFDDSWLDNLFDLGQAVGAQYSNKNLKKLIDKVLGPVTLGQLNKNVLISSFDLDNNDPDRYKRSWKPKFFHNFAGQDAEDSKMMASDVALYTSAAPSYFPAVDGYVDGGVIANNPSMAALAQVLDSRAQIPNRPSLDEVRLLSVGTGKVLNSIRTRRKHLDWGFAQWAKPLLNIMMDGSVGLANFQCKQLLGKAHYRRVNPVLRKAIALDNCDKVDDLMKIGKGATTEDRAELRETAAWLKQAWI
jgi:patatin-like phospholipase/acyl hydrolase